MSQYLAFPSLQRTLSLTKFSQQLILKRLKKNVRGARRFINSTQPVDSSIESLHWPAQTPVSAVLINTKSHHKHGDSTHRLLCSSMCPCFCCFCSCHASSCVIGSRCRCCHSSCFASSGILNPCLFTTLSGKLPKIVT